MNLHGNAIIKDEEQLLSAFKQFDTDNDGSISREELRQALKKHANIDEDIEQVCLSSPTRRCIRCVQILDECDQNKDGKIDFEEFRTMMLGV